VTPPSGARLAGMSHRGTTRSENQDLFAVAEGGANGTAVQVGDPGGAPVTLARSTLPPGGLYLAVTDGMGGPAGGAQAAALASRAFFHALEANEADSEGRETPMSERLAQAARLAHARVQSAAREDLRLQGMGTTLTAAGLRGGSLHLVQVGDSRAYLLRGGTLRQLTRDQSVVQAMVDAGRLSEEEARVSPQRNVILQALGVEGALDPVTSEVELEAGDTVLLCTDGLSGVLSDRDMARILIDADTPEEACRGLVAATLDRGAPDNVTCVVLEVG
jgi:PPM family protein phosphatase